MKAEEIKSANSENLHTKLNLRGAISFEGKPKNTSVIRSKAKRPNYLLRLL